jgi:tripartite-type tricarboxylate transporter receptor subunit TctC
VDRPDHKGAAPAVQDVIAGHVPIMMLDVATGRESIKSGLLKALASASSTRFPDFLDLPTIAELGFPGYEASAWQGIVAPSKTPASIVDTLNAQIGAALTKPAMQQKLRAAGIEPLTSSPSSFAEFMRSETAKWGEVIQAAKISLD